MIGAYRSPGGAGVRLDGGTTHTGAEISAHFDSMLVKLTCRGRNFPIAVRRAQRAVAEFRIRGVSTNIPFLAAVLDDPDFQAGRVTTSFIEERPELLTARQPADRGTRLLTYLAETTVNRPNGPRPKAVEPVEKLPVCDLEAPAPDGSRQLLRELGPERFAERLRAQQNVAVTDTTFRDAHQSLLATRVRSRDLLAVAPYVARTVPEMLQPGVLGRRHVRRGAAVPRRGPVGAARGDQRGGAQHLHADAAAGPQHRGLHALPARR